MSIIRSERTAAAILLGAAGLGLLVANSPAGETLAAIQHTTIGPAFASLSVDHWISDGLLAVFFFIVAVELKHEVTVGELSSIQRAIHPAIAAVGGVVVPALIYLAFTTGSGYMEGWPIPTATDIAFALGVLAMFGRGLPHRIRVFLLALAVLDDLIAIVIIAVFFTTAPQLGLLGLAILTAAAFGGLSYVARGRMRVPLGVLMVTLAVLTWWLAHESGVHATIAGVILGLAMRRQPAGRVTHLLEPWSNGVVLPLFAFSAALVVIPQVPLGGLSAPFWGILVALPLGKLVGVLLGGWLGSFVVRASGEVARSRTTLPMSGVLLVASLAGIGFTVSLLMNELAFAGSPGVQAEGTVAVLLGSGISIVASAILVSIHARAHRRAHLSDRT